MTTEPVRLLDVNVLVAIALDTHVHHQAAHRALQQMGRWATCPMTEAGLARLLLTPAVAGRSVAADEIIGFLTGIRRDPRWQFLIDDVSWAEVGLDTSVLMGRQQITDLHLVELARRHNAVLATFDGRLASSLGASDRHLVELLPA